MRMILKVGWMTLALHHPQAAEFLRLPPAETTLNEARNERNNILVFWLRISTVCD